MEQTDINFKYIVIKMKIILKRSLIIAIVLSIVITGIITTKLSRHWYTRFAQYYRIFPPIAKSLETVWNSTSPNVVINYKYSCNKFINSKVIKDTSQLCIIQTQLLDDNTIIAYPKSIFSDNLPELYLYSHGQDEIINTNIQYMTKLIKWGQEFATHNAVFVASDLQGNNWGNQKSQKELLKLSDLLHKEFRVTQKPNLIAFSMGGMLGYRLASRNPKSFNKVIILAGTLPFDILSKEQCQNLISNNTKIFHGTWDTNVPYNQSTLILKNYCIKHTGKAPKIYLEQGKDHWAVGQLGYTEIIK